MSWLQQLDRVETKAEEFIPADAHLHGTLPRTRYPYSRDIREGFDSNVVMAPVNWILRNFTEADAVVSRRVGKGWEPTPEHELSQLLAKPNPFYSGKLLWKPTVTSYVLAGRAYWQKVRNVFGGVIGYWYIPHFLIEAKWPRDGSTYISHYEYRPQSGGPKIDLAPRDVVHFRFGLDPWNVREGVSLLGPLMREVFTDEEAANFSASILRNMGVPGGVIAPKSADARPAAEDVKAMKEYMASAFRGDGRGDWLVVGTPTEIAQFGFNPESLMLGSLRDIAEERVCAMLGIPAAVVGFGAGLQQTKVGATMRELRQSAWHNCIIPMQNDLANQATDQLVEDFVGQPRRFRITFDRSMVSAFQEEETERAQRIGGMVKDSILRIDAAQELLGLEVDESQAVYLRPTSMVAVAKGDSAVGPQGGAPAPDNPSGDAEDKQELPPAVAARMNGNATQSEE